MTRLDRLGRLLALATLLGHGACFDSLVSRQCAADYASCDGQCVDLTADPDHCGGCGVTCAGTCVVGICSPEFDAHPGGDDVSAGDAGDGADAAPRADAGISCPPEQLACGAECVLPGDDPDNCGRCGAVCGSGICTAGECSDSSLGHVVVIGHDYQESRAGMNRLVGNSVFLATGALVRVAVYEGDAHPAAIAGTDAAIDQVALETGRGWTRIAVPTESDVPGLLAAADVFVVYAQHAATDATLMNLGLAWRDALAGFTAAGGVVVVLETGETENQGTYQIAQHAALFSATGRAAVSDGVATVVAPGDAVAQGVHMHYSVERSTVRFSGTDAAAVVEIAGDPVVFHGLIGPPSDARADEAAGTTRWCHPGRDGGSGYLSAACSAK